MVKYLRYLLSDVELAIQQAPPAPENVLFPDFEEDDENGFDNSKLMRVDDVLGIPAAAFPPDKLLEDNQVTLLLESLQRLWKSWRVVGFLPERLNERQRYNAMLHAMLHEQVNWNYQSGGTVKICHYDDGSFCPFGENGSYCHCKELDDSVKHDLAIWEEHVRSQGIDPYLDLTEDEGAAFEEEMRKRNQQKLNNLDWNWLGWPELINTAESGKFPKDDDNDSDWMELFFWETGQVSHSTNETGIDDIDEDNPDNSRTNNWDDINFDLPFS